MERMLRWTLEWFKELTGRADEQRQPVRHPAALSARVPDDLWGFEQQALIASRVGSALSADLSSGP